MSGSHGVRGRVPARDVRGAVPGVGLRGAQPERARSGRQGRALYPLDRSLLSRGRRGSSGVGARERGRLGRARHHVHGRAARRLRPRRRLGRERRRSRGPAARAAGVAAAGVQFLEVRGAEGAALRPRRAWTARRRRRVRRHRGGLGPARAFERRQERSGATRTVRVSQPAQGAARGGGRRDLRQGTGGRPSPARGGRAHSPPVRPSARRAPSRTASTTRGLACSPPAVTSSTATSPRSCVMCGP